MERPPPTAFECAAARTVQVAFLTLCGLAITCGAAAMAVFVVAVMWNLGWSALALIPGLMAAFGLLFLADRADHWVRDTLARCKAHHASPQPVTLPNAEIGE